MKTRPYLLHALTPLHAGTGQSVDVIDLPIARARATGAPLVQGSSVKGVMREAHGANEARDTRPGDPKDRWHLARAVFGPDVEHASDHAGALAVTDARLFALPVRSYQGTFAWVTSPLILRDARRDLGPTAPPAPTLTREGHPVATIGARAVHRCVSADRIYLEDLDLHVREHPAAAAWGDWLATQLEPEATERALIAQRFIIVDDETMTFLYETAMQIDTRVRIDGETGTVADGALWTEESLPPESVLLGLLVADRSRRRVDRERKGEPVAMTPDAVLDFALGAERVLQFGGKATVGRGRCRMLPVTTGEEAAR